MRRLLVIDSSVSARSPAMRGWLAAANKVLPERFDEVEVWGFDCELQENWVKWRKIKPLSSRWTIQSICYDQKVRRMLASLPADYLSETLVQSTGTHLAKTDIRFIHFWSTAYARAAKERPQFLKLPLKDRFVGEYTRRQERLALLPGNTGEWWCVSRGIAAPIVQDSHDAPIIRCLPNTYNPQRFNHHVRTRWREKMRNTCGFLPEEIILGFSAFGHFERKGLRQAAQTVSALRAKGYPVRMLVLGGRESTIESFKRKMNRLGIGVDGLHFSGLVSEMEKHLSAADAFFMPSHFEAFSIAEIEAAALGLRLYLTSHPGHEMILRESTNGRLLPWAPEGMTRILEEEINSGIIRESHSEVGEALIAETYSETLASYYDMAIARKWPQ